MRKLTITLLAGAMVLMACGGSGDSNPSISSTFRGTLSGQQCFYGTPGSDAASYEVKIDALEPGATVTIVSKHDNQWIGKMTSSSSFEVTSAAANPDKRLKIVGTNVTPTSIDIADTTSCFSFRCCTTVTGKVSS